MKILLIMEEVEERRSLAEKFIENIKNVECFEASMGTEALFIMKKHTPDFVFLNSKLMDGTGFEYANLLREVNCYAKFIFMGEDIEESITAFRFQAFYYLLRPFREEDLQFLLYRMGKEQGEKAKSYLRKLPIEGQEGIRYIFPEDIVYVSKNKENKTVSIYTTNNQYISTYTLQELENKLNAYDFLRVHKSYLINMSYVQELKPYYNGTYNLYLDKYDEQPIPVSRNYVKRLRNKIEL
ncbi:two-component system response regulator [Bacillus cereus]|uniref:DNA-binding response regulator n=1 Tax=Bacillus thuringiensis serovar mexicanensis TaxID=180868 RepID=A0A242W184_BACTU|nr:MULTISPECIES: LytTR family DNA-binding domain-containing protein [Bacillus cereus group]EDX55287.1 putative response regulator [Bacillus cereus W]KWU67126.1 two-component system response regulator [Bacillus cereus]MCU5429401.1 LytTR family DNA-binding domain-containing protein [Bacillus cereus]MDQ4440370.1 LytTR family DNA-binding domain-containing protein [Bacillus cereus]MEB9530131.1 LytTR family DNA-binding domain-containing protein [Bacillus anthracis]